MEITDSTKGYILNSATKRWRLTIDDNGVLLRTALTLLFSLAFMCGAKAQVRDLVYGTNNVVIGPTNGNRLAFTNLIRISDLEVGDSSVFAHFYAEEEGLAMDVNNNSGVTFVGSLGYSDNTVTLNIPLSFTSTNTTAATRTNLGIGGNWLTNTNSPVFPDSQGRLVTPVTIYDPPEGNVLITFPVDSSQTMDPIVMNVSSGAWNTTNNRTALGLGFSALTNTNAINFRTAIVVTVASNLPAPYSGAATTNSLLVADGSGSSTFVSTLPSLSISSGTITASAPVLDLSQTWNNTNIAFTAFRLNASGGSLTNSAAGSLLADFQVGGTNIFSVTRTGIGRGGAAWLTFSTSFASAAAMSGVWYASGQVAINVPNALGANASAVQLASTASLGWSSSTSPEAAFPDLQLHRDAANTLALRTSTNAQTYNVYGSYTNSTNYRRLSVGMSNSGIAYIRPEQAGPSTNGTKFLYISGLPATNTGLPSGVLWNSNGSVVVSP